MPTSWRDRAAEATEDAVTLPPLPSAAPAEPRTRPPSEETESTDKIQVDPLIGKTIGGCHVISLVGRGAMGAVYKARQLSLDRIVAIKTIREGLLNEEQLFLRFRQEARTVSRFTTPHVVQIHEVGFENGIHFLIMEFVSGGNLHAYTAKQPGQRLSIDDAVRFLGQAVLGLSEAEALGIVHRDIKPENLVLDQNRRLKLTDFGIAKVLHSGVSLTLESSILGTPLYMSPEQARGEDVDQRSDIYALGATFYHLVTRVPPVQGSSPLAVLHKKLSIERLSPRQALPDGGIPESFSALIEAMTERDLGRRLATFADVAARLRGIVAAKPAAAPETGRARKRSTPLRILAAAAAALGAAAAAFFLMPPKTANAPAGVDLPPAPGAVEPPVGASPGSEVEPAPVESGASQAKGAELPGDASPEAGEAGTAAAPSLDALAAQAAALAARLAEGPDASIIDGAGALLESLAPALGKDPAADALSRKVRGLIADARSGAQMEKDIEALASSLERELRPPFEGLPALRERCREAFEAPESAGGELRAWIDARKARFHDKLRERVRAALDALLDDGQELRRRVQAGEARRIELRRHLELLRRSREALGGFAPELLEGAGRLPDRRALAELERDLDRQDERQARLEALRGDAAALEKVLAEVTRSSELTAERAQRLEDGVRRLQAAVGALGEGAAPGEIGALDVRAAALSGTIEAWRRHAAASKEALELIGRRRIAAARRACEAAFSDGLQDADLAARLAACAAILDAFAALESLDVQRAGERFAAAGAALDAGSEARAYVERCRARLGALAGAAAELAPVRGGEVRIGDALAVKVAGFYLDRYEASVADFKAFLAAQAVAGDEERRRVWGSLDLFEKHCRLPAYLEGERFIDESWPIEEVNYYQARACVRWRGKDLPALEEWWLAARGPLQNGEHRHRYPSLEGDMRLNASSPAPVQRGSVAKAASRERSVHHLSGNAAEWLKAKGEARTAQLVGGRYLDGSERYLSGERRDTLPLHESGRGYGFRGVLRPRDFFDGLLPEDGAGGGER
jgi:formylglycine-generating enzyme required for sulfatase activity/tRNA A-37 threonylcarbamoyl transferase component Bud32